MPQPFDCRHDRPSLVTRHLQQTRTFTTGGWTILTCTEVTICLQCNTITETIVSRQVEGFEEG